MSNAAIVVNLQRKVSVDVSGLKKFVASLAEQVSEAQDGTFSVALISDRRMIELNRFFRGKETTTDVLSFPYEPDEFESKSDAVTRNEDGSSTPEGATLTFLGDIVISAEQAQKQAKENRLALDDELRQLILHGLLHLCGYDHETDDGQMNKRELQLRKKLKI